MNCKETLLGTITKMIKEFFRQATRKQKCETDMLMGTVQGKRGPKGGLRNADNFRDNLGGRSLAET